MSETAAAAATPTPAHAGTGTLPLFIVPSLIWGTTWLAITFQLGTVAPEVSVAWRFGLASLLLLGWCRVRGISLHPTVRDHRRLVLLGVLLFGLNYVMVYRSEQYLTSGLVAVLFAFIVFWNLLGARIFFGTPAPRAVILGAILGVGGVALLFWPEVVSVKAGSGVAIGVALTVAATLVASAGNLYSQRVFATGIGVVPGTAVAMGYAALAMAVYCAAMRIPFTFDPRPAYVLSLAYLAVFGSVVAFVCYLTLLRRIGAGRSGYTGAVIPAVAMLVSTIFEGYRWSLPALAGLGLVLAGTVLVLRAKERAARSTRPAAPAQSRPK